ncbi:MAG: hypothetical protein WC966_09155 [Bradymonadales bacterium]|jgi:uncharacterized protein YehS (DUF1456 family)
MDLFTKIETTRHFGDTFLIWLWYKSEINDGLFSLSDGTSLSLLFDNQLILESPLAEAERAQLTGANPSVSEEAREALRQGKTVKAAKIALSCREREWKFMLNAQSLAISGLKIPALMTKANDEKLYERQALIEEVTALLRGLFDLFLNERLDEQRWKEVATKINEWAA